MRIFIKVKTKSKKEGVEEISENQFKISVKEPPEKGKANEKVIELLSEFFKTAKSNIEIVSGATSKHKIVEINNDNVDIS